MLTISFYYSTFCIIVFWRYLRHFNAKAGGISAQDGQSNSTRGRPLRTRISRDLGDFSNSLLNDGQKVGALHLLWK